MGAVQIDIYKNEHPFKTISFNDVDTIKGLIKNRWMIDSYFGSEQNFNIYEAGEVKPLNQELICLFVDLDILIEKANLTKKQKYIIEKLMQGYEEEDIAKEFKQKVQRVYEIIDTVAQKIRRENYKLWKYEFVYMDNVRVKWDYKQCNKCGEFKPKTQEFFSPDDSRKDSYFPYCKSCNR